LFPFALPHFGVGHPDKVESVPDVRRANACRCKYRRRNGVCRTFQISGYKVPPAVSNRRINLLSKDDWRPALADEAVKFRPEVARVFKARSFACAGERRTGATSGPDFPVVRPSGKPESVRPSADSGKEMALRKPIKVLRMHVFD
jgi:hypothetical protein